MAAKTAETARLPHTGTVDKLRSAGRRRRHHPVLQRSLAASREMCVRVSVLLLAETRGSAVNSAGRLVRRIGRVVPLTFLPRLPREFRRLDDKRQHARGQPAFQYLLVCIKFAHEKRLTKPFRVLCDFIGKLRLFLTFYLRSRTLCGQYSRT